MCAQRQAQLFSLTGYSKGKIPNIKSVVLGPFLLLWYFDHESAICKIHLTWTNHRRVRILRNDPIITLRTGATVGRNNPGLWKTLGSPEKEQVAS